MKTHFKILGLLFLMSATLQGKRLSLEIPSGDYSLQTAESGWVQIHMDGYGKTPWPGYPGMPQKTVSLSLPDNAVIHAIHVQPLDQETSHLGLTLEPNAPLLPSNHQEEIIRAAAQQFSTNRERYLAEVGLYPAASFQIQGNRVQIRPLQIDRSTGTLTYTRAYRVDVDYSLPAGLSKPSSEDATLMVISSEAMRPALNDFLFWKSCLGIPSVFTSVEWIDANIQGEKRSDRIRNYLKASYQELGLTHLLLVGHREIIPLRKLYPDPENHEESGAVPSDWFFSELSCDWDSDGDGYPGEMNEDAFDWSPELHTGRIPWSDPLVVEDILNRIMTYEESDGTWKSDALLMGAISNFRFENNQPGYYARTDGASLMEKMKRDFFSCGATTLYEQAGVSGSAFTSDMDLTRDNVHQAWSGGHGIVTWWSHGSFQALSRKWWATDNGDSVPTSDEIQREALFSVTDLPSCSGPGPLIFANACDNGWPEKSSLGRLFIKQGCAGIVASSRLSWSVLGWDDVADGGNASMTYLFWEGMTTGGMAMGNALSRARRHYLERFSGAWQHLHNAYTYNLFGDPTLGLGTPAPLFGGVEGRLLDPQTKDPLPHAQVRIQNSGIETVTNEEGVFFLKPVPPGEYLIMAEASGQSSPVTVIAGEVVQANFNTSSVVRSSLPRQFEAMNVPNPFNNTTQIRFSLPNDAQIRVVIFDELGRQVARLWEGRKKAGNHAIPWDSREFSSGLYFYRVSAEGEQITGKMLLVK